VLGKESERERQARLRFEAREAMRAAASVLGLPGGQAPTVTEPESTVSPLHAHLTGPVNA